jgi:hypothetical protein
MASFLSTTDNRPGLGFVRRSFVHVASSGGIVTGPGGKGKRKALFVGVFFVKRPFH